VRRPPDAVAFCPPPSRATGRVKGRTEDTKRSMALVERSEEGEDSGGWGNAGGRPCQGESGGILAATEQPRAEATAPHGTIIRIATCGGVQRRSANARQTQHPVNRGLRQPHYGAVPSTAFRHVPTAARAQRHGRI
jgi:hypothetical protein